jgi:hypothetical protein
MTSSARPVDYDAVHEATLDLLAAREPVALWQALLGHGIGALDGYGGSFWVPEAGGCAASWWAVWTNSPGASTASMATKSRASH